MKKGIKFVAFAVVLMAAVYMGSLAGDKAQLSSDILRLHVVGASDSAEDQALKLQVRDGVLAAVEALTTGAEDKPQAQRLISEGLDQLEQVANDILAAHGSKDRAVVTLGKEAYPTRAYDTFTLPAGVYDSLRITIGAGGGRNWWCVVFPSLCIPAASEGVSDVTAGAGFSDSLSGAITGERQYQVRFFLLDAWGRIEKFFYKS